MTQWGVILNGTGQAFSLPDGMGESVESELKNTQQMKQIVNTEHKVFNFYLQLPNTVQVGAINTTYKTAPTRNNPATPRMETE